MAEEEKEEQVIVIEDLEEDIEEPEEQQEEAIVNEEATSAHEAEESQQETESSLPFSSKKRTIFIILSAVIVVVLVLILYFVFSSKKKPPVKRIQHKEKIVKKKKIVKHNIKKRKPVKEVKGNAPYNPAVDVYFINAMRLQEKGNYKAAINELKQASTDLYLSYYGIGYIYLKMGDIKKAKEYMIDKTKQYLKLTLENNPDYIAGYINLFRVYMSDGEYAKAGKIIDILDNKTVGRQELSLLKTYYGFVVNDNASSVFDLASKYPESPLLNSLLGVLYMKRGDLKKAAEYIDKALDKYAMGGFYYNKMLIEVSDGKYKKAADNIGKTYYMEFDKIKCKNYLSFFLLLHMHKLKAAYNFLNLNKKYYPSCYSHFKIIPTVKSELTSDSLFARRNINYMFAAEILNMYLKPIKFIIKGVSKNIKLGNLYESLGLPKRARLSYQNTAAFAEAVLLSQRAVKFYTVGDLKNALLYYKRALSRVNTSPILLYNVGIMYLKLHNLKDSYRIFKQLGSAYPNFPLPYICLSIENELSGNHKDALGALDQFLVKYKSLGKFNKNMSDLGFMADYIKNNRIDDSEKLDYEAKRLFLSLKAAVDDDFDMLSLEKGFLETLGLKIDKASEKTILEYLYEKYPTDYIKRTISDFYLTEHDYEDAYRALFGIVQYTAEDYYKLGIAYLMDGYPDVADNFFTKSILLKNRVYNAYMAKLIIQAQAGDFKGVIYYLKLILKKERTWLNTDVFLSFNIKLVP